MAITLLLHIQNTEPILGEVDELPDPADQFLKITNPRKLDGKDLHYLAEKVVTVLLPIHNLTLVEIMPSEEEEEIIGFVRE